KRNAVLAAGVAMRRSAKRAIIAPAPAHTPSTAAMTGCGQARMALTRSPVMRVNASSPFISRVSSGPMMSCTSPPDEKLPPFEPIAAGEIGLGPGLAAIPELRRGVQRPIGVGKMRPREAAQVRASRHQNRVHMIGLVDVADGHGGHAGLVANAIGERRLEHAAV